MTGSILFEAFHGIAAPDGNGNGTPRYAVRCVTGREGYFVGKDSDGKACFLIETSNENGRKPPPIRLENLDAQFEFVCQVADADQSSRVGVFTVVRCRAAEPETIRYFLSVCHIIVEHLGDRPSRSALAAAVRRMASIFESISRPPIRSLNGLFGELFVISRCRSPARAVAAWRLEDTSRFDFASGDIRMDVKTCAGRVRKHSFSFDQCNPPPHTEAVVGSLMVERIPGGTSIDDLLEQIETRVSADPDLVLKLHGIVASTLGAEIATSVRVKFDHHLAESSLQFFDLREIPALRTTIPPRVSDVHFSVDLSGLTPLRIEQLVDRDPLFWDLLPAE